MLRDILGGLLGCFAGMFEELCRDLGGKNALRKVKKKRNTKII